MQPGGIQVPQWDFGTQPRQYQPGMISDMMNSGIGWLGPGGMQTMRLPAMRLPGVQQMQQPVMPTRQNTPPPQSLLNLLGKMFTGGQQPPANFQYGNNAGQSVR